MSTGNDTRSANGTQERACRTSRVPRYSGSWIRENSGGFPPTGCILANPATIVTLRPETLLSCDAQVPPPNSGDNRGWPRYLGTIRHTWVEPLRAFCSMFLGSGRLLSARQSFELSLVDREFSLATMLTAFFY